MKIKFASIILLLVSFAFFTSISESTNLNDESIRLYEEADAELNRVFEKLVADIKKNHSSDPFMDGWIEQVKRAQEAWERFRDEDQQVAGFYWRGGGTGRAQTDWETRLTLQRIEDLKKRYDPR